MDWEFIDYKLNTDVGFPTVVAIDSRIVSVADDRGRLILFDVESMSVSKTIVCKNLPLGYNRFRCQGFCARHNLIAVATASGRYVLASVNTGEYRRIAPKSGGPVESVAFTIDGEALALGLGFFNLGSRIGREVAATARVETYGINSNHELRHMGFAVLPGVNTYIIAWHPSGHWLACVSGTEDQSRSFVSLLDTETLCCVGMCELMGISHRRATFADNDLGPLSIIVGGERGIFRLEPTLSEVVWHSESPCDDFVLSSDDDTVISSDGSVIDLETGEESSRLPQLMHCTGLTLVKDGTVVGVTETGVIRRWRKKQ